MEFLRVDPQQNVSDYQSAPQPSKNRAKDNRQRFRSLISEISEVIAEPRLSTNNILAKAITLIALDKFSSKYVSRPTKKEVGSPPPKSSFSPRFKTSQLLEMRGSVAFGVTSAGKIVYMSSKNHLGTKSIVLGNDLDSILTTPVDFLYQVFHNRHSKIIVSLNTSTKTTAKFLLEGNIYTDEDGNELYLTLATKIEPLYNAPNGLFSTQEILVDEGFSYMNDGNQFIDQLLGFDTYHNNLLDYVIEEDLFGFFQNLKSDLGRYGHKNAMVRYHCFDGCLLYVRTQMYPYRSVDGTALILLLSTPLAFGIAHPEPDVVSEGLRILNKSDMLLALLPPFSSLPQPKSLGY